jgi:hypothetical protein
MSKQNNLTDFLTDVADAIREKKGTSEKINPQDFSEEIRGIEGGSPFAVDFGEEIATGNPAFVGALQEDIDYYNEVKARLASGEPTHIIWADKDFQRRIAWIQSEMLTDGGLGAIGKCFNLKVYPYDTVLAGLYNVIPYIKDLLSLKADVSKVTRLGYFLYGGAVGEVDLSFDILQKIEGSTLQNIIIYKSLKLNFPSVTSIAMNALSNIHLCKIIDVNLPLVKSLGNTFRDLYHTEELYLNIPNVISQSFSVYNNANLRICHLKGMQCSFKITPSVLEIESVKYILDNCQAREDGAAYTLTLNATVKQNFMNKCTEGNEEYDAEYAAALASANEKGLTLA